MKPGSRPCCTWLLSCSPATSKGLVGPADRAEAGRFRPMAPHLGLSDSHVVQLAVGPCMS